MGKNPGLSAILSVTVIAVIMLFVFPVIMGAVNDAKSFAAQQESSGTAYTGSGTVVMAEPAKGGCAVEIIADTGMVEVSAGICSGIEIGDTVKVLAGVIQ